MHARRVPAPCVVCLPIGDCCVRHHFMSPQLHTCAHKRAALAAALTRKTLMAGLLATPGLELKSVPSPKGLTPRQLRRLGSTRKHVAWIQSHYTPHTIPAGLVAPMQAICVYQAGDNESQRRQQSKGTHTLAHMCVLWRWLQLSRSTVTRDWRCAGSHTSAYTCRSCHSTASWLGWLGQLVTNGMHTGTQVAQTPRRVKLINVGSRRRRSVSHGA